MRLLIDMLQPLGAVVTIVLGIWVLAEPSGQREPRLRRACEVALPLVCGIVFFSWFGTVAHPELTINGTSQLIGQFLVFTLLYVFGVWGAHHVFEVSWRHAMFCGSAAYIMQNLASGIEGLLLLLAVRWTGAREGDVLLRTAISLSSLALAYVPCYVFFVKSVRHAGPVQVEDRGITGVFGLVILLVILFDIMNKALAYGPTPLFILVTLRVVHGAICVFMLYAQYEMLFAQRARSEAATAQRLLAESQRQYELSRENIEAINIKCHDIRHQIRHLGEQGMAVDADVLADIAREVSVYDAVVRTGNDALDTILTEKSLVCEREGIELTCIADGSSLGFLTPAELYSLFGNALDNAIEATRQVEDPEGRSISLLVRRTGDMVSIHVENTCAGKAEFEDGLPRTTKRDAQGMRDEMNHGIGTRSMRALAEHYGGIFSAAQDGDIFCLDIVLPLPD